MNVLRDATYAVSDSGRLEEVSLTSGYQVSVRDMLKVHSYVAEHVLTLRTLVEISAYAQTDQYVGVWYDANSRCWFVDISVHVHNLDDAKILGSQHDQLAILDWSSLQSIYL